MVSRWVFFGSRAWISKISFTICSRRYQSKGVKMEVTTLKSIGAWFAGTMIYFIGSGVVTAVPLLFFSYGANILPLNVIGFLQYTSPTIVLFLAIFFFHETFSMPQFIAFACIWTALVIFTVSERIVVYRKNRKQR